MSNWLSRMFTIPRKEREKIAQVPGIHLLAGAVSALAVSAAQAVVDQHVTDPELAEKIKAGIEIGVAHAVPIPAAPANQSPIAQLLEQGVEGLISSGLQHLAGPGTAPPGHAPPVPVPPLPGASG